MITQLKVSDWKNLSEVSKMINVKELAEKYNKMVVENKFGFSTIQANEHAVGQYLEIYPQEDNIDEDLLIKKMALYFHYIAFD